jgi:hypothetical protein
MLGLHILVFGIGLTIVVFTLLSAIRTFVLPRGDNVWLTRMVFRAVALWFRLRTRKATTYEQRDRLMAMFAPIALLLTPVVWLILVMLGYTLMFWAVGVESGYTAFKISGSSLFTLGAFTVDSLAASILEFSEATIGLGLVALLISYLPTMYAAFSKRETLVTLLEVRAGSPPSAITLIVRAHPLRRPDYIK